MEAAPLTAAVWRSWPRLPRIFLIATIHRKAPVAQQRRPLKKRHSLATSSVTLADTLHCYTTQRGKINISGGKILLLLYPPTWVVLLHFLVLRMSSDFVVAATTAAIAAALKPFFSRASTAAMVVPPGLQTWSFSTAEKLREEKKNTP